MITTFAPEKKRALLVLLFYTSASGQKRKTKCIITQIMRLILRELLAFNLPPPFASDFSFFSRARMEQQKWARLEPEGSSNKYLGGKKLCSKSANWKLASPLLWAAFGPPISSQRRALAAWTKEKRTAKGGGPVLLASFWSLLQALNEIQIETEMNTETECELKTSVKMQSVCIISTKRVACQCVLMLPMSLQTVGGEKVEEN